MFVKGKSNVIEYYEMLRGKLWPFITEPEATKIIFQRNNVPIRTNCRYKKIISQDFKNRIIIRSRNWTKEFQQGKFTIGKSQL